VALPRSVDSAEHVYHLYVVRHERPDELIAALAERGIQARGYYRVPVHLQPGTREFGATADLPGTEEAARTNLALPMGPQLKREQVAEVVDAVAHLG
jgi:dTDP-4-amino-4,6-dideoxygalactose transaminase